MKGGATTMQNIIFDFNGTLFQDTLIHRRSWSEFFASYGISITDAQRRAAKDLLNEKTELE